jgi:DNA-binding transcriptional LysR family regulator
MDWDKLRIFHIVAEAGSFTRAMGALNLSQSAISRQIAALESDLKVTLFHRHARGLKLTEQGRMLLETTRDINARLGATESRILESRTHPSGPMRVTTTVGFGSMWLSPRIRDFLDLYPDIELTLVFDDRQLDLAMGEADIAIRMAPPVQPHLIQRRLLTVRFYVYAAQSYLKKFGKPERPEDLDQHHLITYGDSLARPFLPNARWLLELAAAKPRRPVLTTNSVYGVFRAVQCGIGLAAIPDYLGQSDPELVRVLPDLEGHKTEAYFVYPREIRNARRLTAFRDFLIGKVAER